MPASITPPPKDDEVECGNCGAYIYHDLLKCPDCGVYLINPFPHIDLNEPPPPRPKSRFALWVESMWRKMRGKAHVAEALFSGAMRETALFDDLLKKAGGDRSVVERLIEHEKQQSPGTTRSVCLQNAIRRWERDNS
jgi:hypothetical protein